MAVIRAWTEPILSYLLRKELPVDKIEARRIVRQAVAYAEHDEELYKWLNAASPVSSKAASLRRRDNNFFLKFMLAFMDTMRLLGPG